MLEPKRDPDVEINFDAPVLHDAETGEAIRNASREETAASRDARKPGERHGIIDVEGRTCYVVEWDDIAAAADRKVEGEDVS